jgi:hypothetical protein
MTVLNLNKNLLEIEAVTVIGNAKPVKQGMEGICKDIPYKTSRV